MRQQSLDKDIMIILVRSEDSLDVLLAIVSVSARKNLRRGDHMFLTRDSSRLASSLSAPSLVVDSPYQILKLSIFNFTFWIRATKRNPNILS